jgi:hypothetical protein
VTSIESIHPDPYHDTDAAAFRAAASELKARLPDLTENEAMVGLLRLYGRITTTRGEGHSHAALSFPLLDRDHPMLPLHLWLLDGGLFVVDALPPHEDLIGSRVSAIGERPVIGR